jgi:hypothetical protein
MKKFRLIAIVAALAVVGGALAADETKANLQLTMLTKVNPNGLALWEVTNKNQDADGNLDGKKLTAATWAQLEKIGKALEEGGRTLATSNGIIAAPPGAKLQDEDGAGSSKAADVQRFIDAKPAVFRTHALELQKTGAGVAQAANKHDVKRIAALADSLDSVCEECHVIFWYPQQQKK